MGNVGGVDFLITAENKDAINKIKETETAVGGMGSKLGNISGLMKSAFAVYAVAQFTNAMQDCLKAMSDTQTAMKGLISVSESYAQSTATATKYAQELASDGLISITDSAQTLKNLLGAGFNIDEAFNIAKSMKDIGAFNNTVGNLGQAMQDSAKGIKTNSMELIENIGLTTRIGTIMKQNNIDMSNGIDLTNNATQRQAVYNSIISEGARNMGNAAKFAEDYAGKVSKSKAAFKELQNEIGSILSGPAGKILEMFAGGAKELRVIVEQINKKDSGKVKQESEVDKLKKEYDALYKLQNDKSMQNMITDYQIAKNNNKKISDDKIMALNDYFSRLQKYNEAAAKYAEEHSTEIMGFKPSHLGKMSFEAENAANAKTTEDLKKRVDAINRVKASIEAETQAKETARKANERAKQNEMEQLKYFEDLNKKMVDAAKLSGILGSSTEEIQSEQIKIVADEIDKLGKSGDMSSIKFEKLVSIFNELVDVLRNLETIDIDIDFDPNKNLTGLIKGQYTDTGAGRFNYETSKPEQMFYGGSGGTNYGSYYGKMAYEGQLAGMTTKRVSEGASSEYDTAQAKYYKELQKRVELVNTSIAELGTNFQSLGDVLGNDLISATGKAINAIGDFNDYMSQIQAGKQTGGMMGTVSQVSGVAGIVATGLSIFKSLSGAGDKQESAAEKMAKAVEEFKQSIQGMTIKEISTQGQSLADQLATKNKELTDLKKIESDFVSSTSIQKYKESTGKAYSRDDYTEWVKNQNFELEKKYGTNLANIQNKIGKTIPQEIATLQAELATIKPTIIEALKITWEDLASGVTSAFDASNLTDFYSQFKTALQENIKDALISAFLQSEAMKTMFTTLSDSIYQGLADVGFDASQLTSEQMDAWNSQINLLATEGGAFYEVLVKLGLAGAETADSLSNAASIINGIPEGLKVAAYRFKAVETSVTSKTSTGERIYEPGNQPFVGGVISGPTYNINTVSIPIQSTMNSAEVQSAVLKALDSIENVRVG